MRKFYIFIVMFCLLSPICLLFIQTNKAIGQCPANDQEFRAGCCSRHGGACGCAKEGLRCCDGTISPTCGC